MYTLLSEHTSQEMMHYNHVVNIIHCVCDKLVVSSSTSFNNVVIARLNVQINCRTITGSWDKCLDMEVCTCNFKPNEFVGCFNQSIFAVCPEIRFLLLNIGTAVLPGSLLTDLTQGDRTRKVTEVSESNWHELVNLQSRYNEGDHYSLPEISSKISWGKAFTTRRTHEQSLEDFRQINSVPPASNKNVLYTSLFKIIQGRFRFIKFNTYNSICIYNIKSIY